MRDDLISKLISVQNGDTGIQDFELWLTGRLQSLISHNHGELKRHVDWLDSLLIEYSENLINRRELSEAFEDVIRNLTTKVIIFPNETMNSEGEGSSTSVAADASELFIPFDIIEGNQDLLLKPVEVS